jgi:hypothetical protein
MQQNSYTSSEISRRRLLLNSGMGFGWLALAWLMQRDVARATDSSLPGEMKPHFPPRVKRVLQVFCAGGMSHIDTFDYKPELEKQSGKPYHIPTFFGQPGSLMPSPWEFKQHGQSGLWVSSLLPNLAKQTDKLTLVRTMVAKSANHMPALAQMNTGFVLNGFPAMGAWVTYALGSENANLPSFVVLPDANTHPYGGPLLWSNGFLPAAVQGTAFRGTGDPVPDLSNPKGLNPATREAGAAWLAWMNRRHSAAHPGDSTLDARIRSYELAASMQLSVPGVADLGSESAITRRLYGLDEKPTAAMAKNCLLARRLIERGVRFVQVYHGGATNHWDSHENIRGAHAQRASEYDQPVAALLQDLDERGLLKDTLVMGITEFGRTPVSQGSGSTAGRDHNPECFTCWMAGAGLKAGFAYGTSDELGFHPAENPVTIYDLHATALHLLGLDHEKLTFYHNGIRRRLTDVHGHVVRALLA